MFNKEACTMKLNFSFFIVLILLVFFISLKFDIIKISFLPNREARLKIKDNISSIKRFNPLKKSHEYNLTIPYYDIIEADTNYWFHGNRIYNSNKIAIVVIDIFENVQNIDQFQYQKYLRQLSGFLTFMSNLGVKIIHSHSAWEGKIPSSILPITKTDVWVLNQSQEQEIVKQLREFDLVILVGTAGDKCVLTRPLGVINLTENGIQTIFLWDLIIYMGEVGSKPVFSPTNQLLQLIALNWGYVGKSSEISNKFYRTLN